MLIRYTATLNTGEIIANSVAMTTSAEILSDIWKDVKNKIYKLSLNKTAVVKTVSIRYLTRNMKKHAVSEVSEPYTMCI